MTEQFESLKTKLNHIGMMGQWYQRYDIAKSAQEANKIIEEIQKKLNEPEPCGMSRK
jgi:hypothetical protein